MHFRNKLLLPVLVVALITAGLAGSAAGQWQSPPPPGTIDENGVEWGPPVDMDAAEDVSNKYETDEETKRNTPPADAVKVTVDSVELFFREAWPYINKDGRVMVPVRRIAEKLQGTVTWDEATKTVSIYRAYQKFMWDDFREIERPELNITLKIGDQTATVNNQTVTMDTYAEIKNGRTVVPLRFVAENLGADVEWVDYSRTVKIEYSSVNPSAK